MAQLQKIIYLTLSILISGSLFAQENWSLEQCINYALKNNLTNHDYALQEQAAKIDATQSKLNLLPSVSASSSAGINFGRSIDPNTNAYVNTEFFNNSNGISSSISLFRGFMQINRIAYSKYRMKAAQWQKINYQDDLAFNVLMAYYDVVYYKGLVDIANGQLKLSEISLKKTNAQIDVGLKAKTDLAEIQATYEKEKLNLIQAENKLAEVRISLAQQMNLPGEKFVGVEVNKGEPSDEPNASFISDSLYTSYADFSPYLKMAEAELNAAIKNVAVIRGQYFPSISVGASVNTGYSETNRDDNGKTIPFNDQFNNNMRQYVGASISIPIFSRNQIRNDLRKAKLDREHAETQLESYRQNLYYDFVNNTRELQALYREYVQGRKQVDADQLAFQAAERKYDEGLIDVIELLTVKNRLATDKSQLLWARLQWEVKDKMLDFYEGVRFWEQ